LAGVACAADPTWGGRLIVDDSIQNVVGTCAFKTLPVGGEVEIAYCTFAPYESQCYATAMASLLVDVARNSGQVECVVAHTLPKTNASTRVLEKNQFRRAGTGMDDEVGLFWRWERELIIE